MRHLVYLLAIIPPTVALVFGFAVRWGHIDIDDPVATLIGVMLPIGVAMCLALYAYLITRSR